MKKQRCIICDKEFNSGIIIKGRGICTFCKDRLMNLNEETDFYEYYRRCIKKTLCKDIKKEGEDRFGKVASYRRDIRIFK